MTAGIDSQALRTEQFPVTRRGAYLDHATFGPLPRATVEAAAACLRELSEGHPLPLPWAVEADRVRAAAGRLLGCTAADVAFLKSTAEAMGLVALGLDWRPGDEVVVYEHQFPAGVMPWLGLAHLGVTVRYVRDRGRHRFDAADVEELIGERTRAVCLELVNFGTGFRVPVEAVARACRARGAWLLVDATQAAGVLRLDAGSLGCDLLAAHAYKFLASGYGTAACYVSPALRARLRVPEPGWRTRPRGPGPRMTDWERQDVVEEASRFEPSILDLVSVVALGATLGLFAALGPDAIEAAVLRLSGRAARALAERGFRVVSPMAEGERSAIISLERGGVEPAVLEEALRSAGVAAAVREDRLRLSFHCYNDDGDIDRVLGALAPFAARRAV